MTEAEILALIAESLSSVKTEILTETTNAQKGLAASITREIKKLSETKTTQTAPEDEPTSESTLSLKALQKQLSDMQSELANEKASATKAKRDSALVSAIQKSGAINQTALKKLLSLEYGERLKSEGDRWYLEDGETATELQDVVASYLKSDEGKHFVPASGVQGSGSKETPATTTLPDKKLSAEDALYQAFNL